MSPLRLLRLALYIRAHEERLLVELLAAKDADGFAASESPVLTRLQGLFSLIVETRP
jgi:hypothetical protein